MSEEYILNFKIGCSPIMIWSKVDIDAAMAKPGIRIGALSIRTGYYASPVDVRDEFGNPWKTRKSERDVDAAELLSEV